MMKTSKIWSIMIMLVVVLFSTFSFTSCGGDDDTPVTNTVINPIVGTKWIGENGKYLHFKTLTTGIYYNGASYDKGNPYEDFTYTFNTTDNTILFLFGDEYESAQYTSSYILWKNRKYYKE